MWMMFVDLTYESIFPQLIAVLTRNGWEKLNADSAWLQIFLSAYILFPVDTLIKLMKLTCLRNFNIFFVIQEIKHSFN